MATEAVFHSVKLTSRTLAAVPATSSDGRSQWVVGTTSLREENEVRGNTCVPYVHSMGSAARTVCLDGSAPPRPSNAHPLIHRCVC